ncbi:hypothetical protein TanjilG_10531 [Lupinus angustifolius]|uniref:Disease resistance N-terminal domain-containing protein n=1 Tax=Lupinus angustifolius TaxID=3871 RepID=A0A1J7GD63_LUPAN|nr:hypothetical protein TanjilG_10531 [Lupinus angustifolius]
MAESSLSFIADSLITKIDSSHIYEASLDIGVYVHLQSFKESLLSMKACLQKVDLEKEQLYSAMLLLREIKHVLYDAENVLDEFEYERLRNEVVNADVNSITKVLNLVGCTKLENLPKGLRNLSSLRQLGITTKETVLPENDIANLKSLEILNIESCENLESLFIGIKLLTLRTLTVTKYCKNLEVLPEWLSTFSSLGSFGMANCPKLTFLPNDIHRLTALGYLRIEGCPKLCRKCQPQVGEYWPKISHINQIFIDEPEDLKEDAEEERLEVEQ